MREIYVGRKLCDLSLHTCASNIAIQTLYISLCSSELMMYFSINEVLYSSTLILVKWYPFNFLLFLDC